MGDNWKTHAKSLSKVGYKVHLIDQRNHGKSFWSNSFNYSLMASDLVNYCNTHNLHKALFLGHSMGGKVAMNLACEFPEIVKAFIVADIAPKNYEPHHHEILIGLSNLDFKSIDTRLLADKELAKYVEDSTIRQFLLKNLYWKTSGDLALRVNIDILKDSSKVIARGLEEDANSTHPCLFIKGENSDYILESDKDKINYHFPNAQHQLITEVGHWLHAEDPNQFFNIIYNWLEKFR
jgi:pimeloyl-ACP methyl ester carboxylesterase